MISAEKAPIVKITSKGKSRVDAKAFKHGKKVIVFVTADGPGLADATLTIPGIKGQLKSKFNLTKANNNGTYTFKAQNVNSDVLEGELQ